ncbi:MAG: ABC transporter ATP-binding protein [Oscillospiraceae bacterium]|nr:ABC transporter ATP-binding protein [Oscillospiraceae bacterium]
MAVQKNKNRPPRGRGSFGASDKKGTAKRLLAYITRDHLGRFLIVVACIILAAFTSIYGSMFLMDLIDVYIKPLIGTENPVLRELVNALSILAVVYAVGIVSNLLYARIMAVISQRILRDIRQQMFFHMQDIPVGYFDSHTFGNVMSFYTNDTDTLRQMLGQSVPSFISSVINVIAIFCSMLTLSWHMTIVVVVMVFIIFMLTKFMGGKSGRYFYKQQVSIGKTNGFIEEMINGQKVVKVFCHEEQTKADFDKLNEELFQNASKANQLANALMPIMANVGNLQYILIAVVGGALAVGGVGGITLGAIVSFLQLSRSFSMPVNQLSMQINYIVMALAGAERIFSLIDEKEEVDEGKVTLVNAREENGAIVEAESRTGMWAWKQPDGKGGCTYTKLAGDVRFKNVNFSYVKGKQVLHDISLYAKPGQKIAFVGATGAGKTTITNLINRFYDVDEGQIVYDGIDVRHIKKDDLRRSLGIVLQDVNLFTGTVMDNIRYGRLDATDEECIEAAKKANAHGFITMLPDGYNTMLEGDGSGLSQGQRQLLSIARVAVADPPVMILDEATSSIDTRTEAIVQDGMDKLMQGRTVFVIAHRLSTIRNSNSIMVMDQGRIIERGDHDELIEQRGKYYQLYTGAFELE